MEYAVAGCDPAQSVVVEIVDANTGLAAGAKRLRGETSYRIDAAGYATSLCNPLPAGAAGFSTCPGRSARIKLKVGETVSEERMFTCAACAAMPFKDLSCGPAERVLAAGEWDEIGFLAQPSTLSAHFRFSGPGGEWSCADGPFTPDEGCAALRVDMAALAGRMAAAGKAMGDYTTLEVEISDCGERIMSRSYRLYEHNPDGVRLVWLNGGGGMDAYTFCGTGKKGVDVKKNTAADAAGMTAVTGTESRRTAEILSDYESGGTLEWLEGAACSPRVWVVRGQDISPVIVTAAERIGDGPSRLRVVYRSAAAEKTQRGLW